MSRLIGVNKVGIGNEKEFPFQFEQFNFFQLFILFFLFSSFFLLKHTARISIDGLSRNKDFS